MRLTRVYVEGPVTAGKRLLLEGSAANHIARVLRLRAGDALTVFNGDGGEFAARVDAFQKDSVAVSVEEYRAIETEAPVSLTLAQGISRGERMDWVIQKATELGASRIVPVFTKRSVVRLDERQAERKLQHWRAIAIAACEQCGRNRLPELPEPMELYDLLSAAGGGFSPTRLLLSPTGSARLVDVEGPGAGITVLIGPEGGLEDIEQETALAAGFKAVRLGPRVLRTETAAIAALTIIQHRFGDL